jgi:hypothetical protein
MAEVPFKKPETQLEACKNRCSLTIIAFYDRFRLQTWVDLITGRIADESVAAHFTGFY